MKTVITANEGVRGGKTISLKQTVNEALTQCPDVSNVFVYQRTSSIVPSVTGRDVCLEEVCLEEVCHLCYVTFVMSPLLCHLCYVTFVMSPLLGTCKNFPKCLNISTRWYEKNS